MAMSEKESSQTMLQGKTDTHLHIESENEEDRRINTPRPEKQVKIVRNSSRETLIENDKVFNISPDTHNFLSNTDENKQLLKDKFRSERKEIKVSRYKENDNIEPINPETPNCYIIDNMSNEDLAMVEMRPATRRHSTRDATRDDTAVSSTKTEEDNEDRPMISMSNADNDGDDPHDVNDEIEDGHQFKDNISTILSIMYGVFMSVLSAVLPITETFAERSTPYMFEIFYIYMYITSVIFIAYIHVCVLQRRSKIVNLFLQIIQRIREKKSFQRQVSLVCSCAGRDSQPLHIPTKTSTGSFPLRIAAVVFGIASMIHSGLNFAYYFQVNDGNSVCHHPIQAIKPFLHLAFTFSQLYFIFLHSKLNFIKHRVVARIGLMHLWCSNLAVWFRCIVVETLDVITRVQSEDSGKHGVSNRSTTTSTPITGRKILSNSHLVLISAPSNGSKSIFMPEISCYWTDLFGKFVQMAGPYLYPCKIEYSIICAAIIYAMWKNIGRNCNATTFRGSRDTVSQNGRKGIDCSNSMRGLFSGILVTVGAIITMIAFYVLVSKHPMSSTSIILVHVSETSMYILLTGAIILAADKMKNLKFKNKSLKNNIELRLLFLSFTGLFTFAVFGIVAAAFETHNPKGVLNILTNLFMILQSTIQALFIVAATKLMSPNEAEEEKKKGREFVTFLILCNFALWAMNTFETQTPEHNPVQMDFYGPLAWSVLTHITVPLGIYFRFHSAICLINIWRFAWRFYLKPDREGTPIDRVISFVAHSDVNN